MYSITGVISAYNPKSSRITIKVYNELNGKDIKTPTNEWASLSVERALAFKPGDQIKAQVSADKKDLVTIAKLDSKSHDKFKQFFIELNLKGTSMKDRIRLFNAFGVDVLNLAKDRIPILVNNATRYGYSMQSAVKLGAKAERLIGLYKGYNRMTRVGFAKEETKYLMEKFGAALGNVVMDNPYMLLAGGFTRFSDPFSNVDKERAILSKVDKLVDNPALPKWQGIRNFYILEMIVKRLEGKGSTAFSKTDVNQELSDVLGIDYTEAGEVLEETLSGKAYKTIDAGNDGYFITPAKNYNLEESIAIKLIERSNVEGVKVSSRDLIFEDYYTDEQRQSIKLAIEKNLLVVTGGAGTGKTTVVKGIMQNIKKVFGRHSEILLCAPTGKAAQRMSEATSLEARTLHSMLKFNPEKGFMEADIPADTKAIIIDEASMIDSALMLKLLESVPDRTKIILVGDIQQILPVKPGQPFKDMILSEFLPTVKLSVPQRTGNKSYIYLNANKVINGVMPTLKGASMDDFHFMSTNSDADTSKEIQRILAEDIESVYGSNMSRVQVISPKREPKGHVGMIGLNRSIQSLLNPDIPSYDKNASAKIEVQIGDKVVFNRNDYKLKLFNGDVGYVTKKDDSSGSLTINVDGKSFDLTRDKVKSLDLAFALSAHKTQGSEYDVVIMPLSKSHAHMLSPELLYTAITRAKKHFIFVGNEDVIKMALKNIHLNKRDTYLKARLISAKMEINKQLVGDVSVTLEQKAPEIKSKDASVPSSQTVNREVKSVAPAQEEEEFDWNFEM